MIDAPGAAFLRAVGLLADPTAATAIHPNDEMLRWLDQPHVDRRLQRAEYLRQGYEAAMTVAEVCRVLGLEARPLSVLDYASGYGRTARFLRAALGDIALSVSDIQDEAVDYAGRITGAMRVPAAWTPGELELRSRHDLVFVGSLFTHLRPEQFGDWIERLYRICAPSGALMFSTHGLDEGPMGRSHQFEPVSESARLPRELYGTTDVDPLWVKALIASRGLPLALFVMKGLWLSQDIYVISRRPCAKHFVRTSIARGAMTIARTRGVGGGGDGLLCTGWVEAPQPVSHEAVTVRCGTMIAVEVPLSRLELRGSASGDATVHRYAWTCAGDIPGIDRGAAVTASVRLADGTTSCFAAAFVE